MFIMYYTYLLRCAENVSVVLAEPSNASKTAERARKLVTV